MRKLLLAIALMIGCVGGGHAAHLSDLEVKANIKFTTSYFKVVDFATRYQGYYEDNYQTMVFTGVIGNGTPYWVLIGFDDFLNGKTVTLKSDNKNIGFTSKNFKVEPMYSGDDYWVDIEGASVPQGVLGFDMRHGEAPSGTYNFEIQYEYSIFKLKVIVQ